LLHQLVFALAIAPLGTGLVAAGTGAFPTTQGPRTVATADGVLVGAAQEEGQDTTRYARSLLEEAGDPRSLQLPIPEAGGSAYVTVQPLAGLMVASKRANRIFEITLHPGAGYTEKFLFAPANSAVPRPLLVAFHKFGVSQLDILDHTSFFREGIQRTWHVVAPLGASGVHFSSIPSQINTEAVLNWVKNHYLVDTTRVYGVGFSMGGGAVLNYAARHLDPAKLMFAAVVNHTGVISLEDAYVKEPGSQFIMDFWFGTNMPGTARPWDMQRSSVLSIDPVTLQIDDDASLARNLMHLRSLTYRASNDPTAYLIPQNDMLHSHLVGLGAQPGEHDEIVLNGSVHTWDLINEHTVCNWLMTQHLTLPTSGNTLADRDGNYFNFVVGQDTVDAFTPFVWNVNAAGNSFDLSATANLRRLSIKTAAVGLQPNASFTATLATADGAADELELLAWGHLPTNVLRDNVATTSWTYDATSGNLVLLETSGAAAHTWKVLP
jgi:pimeloyl-ACP methyl ester carboxylesterase